MAGWLPRLKRWLLPGRGDGPGPAAAPSVPDGMIVYAIGDIHGERALLERLLSRIRDDAATAGAGLSPVAVFLGDYVDRGPDSRGVLDLLSGDPLPGFTVRRLMGNHEQAMLAFLDDPVAGAEWLTFGGAETLGSYGVRSSVGAADPARCRAVRDQLEAMLPDRHRSLLEELEPYAVYGGYAFVHAGIRPRRPLERQTLQDLLWIRGPFLDSRHDHGKVVVHGHTIVPSVEVHRNRIAVDTGAYATGRLSAIACAGDGVRILDVARG